MRLKKLVFFSVFFIANNAMSLNITTPLIHTYGDKLLSSDLKMQKDAPTYSPDPDRLIPSDSPRPTNEHENSLKLNSLEYGSQQIGPLGGELIVQDIGSIFFPSNVLPSKTIISLKVSESKNIQSVFQETADIFRVSTRSKAEYRIGSGSIRPYKNTTSVTLFVPPEILKNQNPNFSITVFSGIEQGGENEIPFTVFEIIDSTFDKESEQISFLLPAYSFAKNELTNGEYQAILIIGITPG